MKSLVQTLRQNISWRSSLVFAFDLASVALAWLLAYQLRFNFSVPADYLRTSLTVLICILPLNAALFRVFGLYRGIWVFASLPDGVRIVRAVCAGAIGAIVIVSMLQLAPPVPRSVFVIHPVLLLVIMGGSRIAYRAWREHRRFGGLAAEGRPVILLGAGATGSKIARELAQSAEWKLVGFLDDDLSKRGRELHGARILGPFEDLGHWASLLKAQHAIVAMPAASLEQRKRALAICVRSGVRAMVVPDLQDFIRHGSSNNALRAANLEDLLGREPVSIDIPNIDGLLGGRTILITGAGGSIGSELCRQAALFRPGQIVAYEANEFALYRLMEEFADRFPDVTLTPITGDVRDVPWLEEAFRRYQPAVVFHAAAYKHVPMMEEDNAWQAMSNNVLGTWRVATLAAAYKVERFVLVSTDKAVNPTNVMGATKRLAELVCQTVQATSGGTTFCSVRFGNVLGSAGSVVPKFEEQIARGGPVTVTHPEITRYFMTIPEAAQLLLQAAVMGKGGEIFVMDMGEPVKIVDLARDMIRLAGESEDTIKIEFSGLRPGEKLYEELLADDEQTLQTHHPKLRVAKARGANAAVVDEVVAALRSGKVLSGAEIRRDLRRWVPEYAPAIHRAALAVVSTTNAEASTRDALPKLNS